MKTINCFIPFSDEESTSRTIISLKESKLVNTIYVLYTSVEPELNECKLLKVDNPQSAYAAQVIAENANKKYSLIITKPEALEIGAYALERLTQVANDTQAGLLYSDYYQILNGECKLIPTIDYQLGSLRDDFNFGAVLLYNSEALKAAEKNIKQDFTYAGLYALRLQTSISNDIFHLNEPLYTIVENDNRKSGEKQFDYVDPKNRMVQIEMEQACTAYLKHTGAYLEPNFKQPDLNTEDFKLEASVIIPVRNRAKTIEDAIQSVLSQECEFKFNLIVVDNYSTDGTSEIISKYAELDNRVIHLIPERGDLGIGGCWTHGVMSEFCGKFAVQLDSDDVYSSPNTLDSIVNAFYEQQCAMVIGSYTMTNFDMETIAPGLIDHKEWTPENGRNNALRINGLGAPRAFFTPLLREIKVPNTSYGEDYALGLRISRDYQIGRIYNSVYLCRRWDENSDAALDIQKQNAYNSYKDKLRTIEMKARIRKSR